MEVGETLLALWGAAVIGGPTMAIVGYENFKKSRKLEDKVTVSTATAAHGEIEMQGYAWPSEELIAPLSKKKVSFYLVEFFIRSKYSNVNDEAVFRITAGKPFFLADEKGIVMIGPNQKLDLDVSTMSFVSVQSLDQVQRSELWNSLNANDHIRNTYMENVVIKETVLEVGSPIYISGVLSSQPEDLKQYAPVKGLSEFMFSARKQFIIDYIKSNKKTLPSVDAPWAKLVAGAKGEALSKIQTEDLWGHCHGLVRQGLHEPMFVSNSWQQNIKKRLGSSHLFLIIAGGFIFSLAIVPVIYFIWDRIVGFK